MGKDKFWFTISQSSMKDLERPESCPYKWKLSWIDGERQEPSIYMNQGSYFETKCLGSGALPGQDVMDLPRLKNGEKSSAHKRIDEQVDNFKDLLINELGHEITEVQRVIKTNIELNDGTIVELRGVIDFETIKDSESWIWDLKLTGDVTSSFGPYPWGDIDNIDFTQQVMYHFIDEKNTGIPKKMGMSVFDTSPRLGVKIIYVDITEENKEELISRIESFVKALKYYKENGFTKFPSEKECKKCPFFDECDQAYGKEIVI